MDDDNLKKYATVTRRTAKKRRGKWCGGERKKGTQQQQQQMAVLPEQHQEETPVQGEAEEPPISEQQAGPSNAGEGEVDFILYPAPKPQQPSTSGAKNFKKLKNISEDKLENTSFTLLEDTPSKRHKTRTNTAKLGLRKPKGVFPCTGYKLVDFPLFANSLESFAVCGKCKRGKVKLLTDGRKQKCGLAEPFILSCSICDNKKGCFTSGRAVVDGKPGFFDVNVRSVLGSQPMGQNTLGQFCAAMDLPQPVGAVPYNKIQKHLRNTAQTVAAKIMEDAAKRLFDIVRKDEPENIITSKYGELAKVSVTCDGTWQRRGHASKMGVVFVLSVDTGEILDYEVKSLFCQECNMHPTDSLGYNDWKKKHDPHCNINHEGSAARMENDGVIAIFLRSIEKYHLLYHTFVGDGDTGSFGGTHEACIEKYGELYTIQKEECVGHIQKRMGSGLREYKRKMKGVKLKDGKGVGGAGRLTDKLVDKFQNNFGEAIRNNVGDKNPMYKAIWAIFKHRIRNDEESLDEQHDYCPRDGWCKHWSDPKNYDDTKRLPHVFLDELKPLFTRLTNNELLDRCLRGLTQNQNEAANQILWSKCPKTKFCGKIKLELAVSETVGQYNTGCGSRALLLKKCGVVPHGNMLLALRKVDKVRIKKCATKITQKARLNRRKRRAKKKSKSGSEKESYMAGGFGLAKAPEELINLKEKQKKKSAIAPIELKVVDQTNNDNPPSIVFIDDNTIPCFITCSSQGSK